MRFGTAAPACMMFFATVFTASADVPKAKTTPKPTTELSATTPKQPRRAPFFSFRSLALQVDNQVVANLLSDAPARPNDITLTVLTGEIARCEQATCAVPMNVRVENAQGPVAITFAVANPRGELSATRHAECFTGNCVVSLILERGQNTVSVGVLDGIAQATGFTTLRVNATRSVAADRGKSEWF